MGMVRLQASAPARSQDSETRVVLTHCVASLGFGVTSDEIGRVQGGVAVDSVSCLERTGWSVIFCMAYGLLGWESWGNEVVFSEAMAKAEFEEQGHNSSISAPSSCIDPKSHTTGSRIVWSVKCLDTCLKFLSSLCVDRS